jgi:hypothetical protein
LEETGVGGGGEGGGIYRSYLGGGGAECRGGIDHGGGTHFEFDGLRDYGFEEFGDVAAKGEGHDTVGAVVIYVKT